MFNKIFKPNNESDNIPEVENVEDNKNVKKNDRTEKDLHKLLNEILNEFIIKKPTFINAVERGIYDRESLKKELFNYVDKRAYDLTENDKESLLTIFETYIWGYGPLQELIDSDTITDIRTIRNDNVRIKEFGKRKKSNVIFDSKESLIQYINYVAIKNNATLSETNAMQKITDKTSSSKFILRINICSEFINSVSWPYLVIRKIPKKKLQLEELKNKNMFNDEIEDYLIKGMEAGLSMFVSGKGAVGKTYLLNALIDKIPFNKSGLVIQESEELFTNVHPDIMFQKVKYSKGESKIEYTLKDLSINGLLTDLDYFIIGEIKGEEAWDMLNATYTGHITLSSVHSPSSMETMDKLTHYVRYSKFASGLKQEEILKMLSYIDVLVYMKDFKTVEITEIQGYDFKENKLIFNKVFEFEISKVNGKLEGKFVRKNDSCKKIKDKILYSQYIRENTQGGC